MGHAKCGHADVSDGKPALHFVMSGAVENVGDAHRRDGRRCLQAGESCGIVYDIVRDENFSSAAPLKVAGGRIVKPPKHGNTGKQQDVRAVPEAVDRSLLDD